MFQTKEDFRGRNMLKIFGSVSQTGVLTNVEMTRQT